MTMELDWIEAFVAIVKHGGFTRASALLHLSQPAITRRVQGWSCWKRRKCRIRVVLANVPTVATVTTPCASPRTAATASTPSRTEASNASACAKVGHPHRDVVDKRRAGHLRRVPIVHGPVVPDHKTRYESRKNEAVSDDSPACAARPCRTIGGPLRAFGCLNVR